MRTTIRWIALLPLALLASIVAGGVTNSMATFFGGSAWYGWLASGAASAWAFFYVAFRVAPAPSRAVKWLCVGVVGTIGALSAAGPIVAGSDPVTSLAGAVMVGVAVYYARRPLDQVAHEATSPLF